MTSRCCGGWWTACSVLLAAGGGLSLWSLSNTPRSPDASIRTVVDDRANACTLKPEQAAAQALIEAHVYSMLTPGDQRAVVKSGAYTPPQTFTPVIEPRPAAYMTLPKLGDEEYQTVRRVISREGFLAMAPVHQRALIDLVEARVEGREMPAFCFQPDTSDEVVQAFNRAAASPFNPRFQQAQRWSTTATNPGPLGQGEPCTLTYSFVPDGTIVPTLTNGVTQPSDLFARMAVIYGAGNTATWQGLYAQVFNRWSQVMAVQYVLEPNDDGSDFGAPGQLGVRGDLRMAGTPLDGNSGVLAFNYFPSVGIGGDMVIDTNDTFFNTTTTNSLRLRNVLAHEHGHGAGMAHVCPRTNSKLMEPFISTNYDGPQLDDILNGQRHYGDQLEPNDSAGTATVISNLSGTLNAINQVSLDNNTETDWFQFTVSGSGTQTILMTATPIGSSYLEGPQTSACDVGSPYDPSVINPLTVTFYASNGTTVLGSATAPALGQPALGQLVVSTPGTYFARISTSGTTNNIQPYNLSYQISNAPGLSVAVQGTTPALISPTSSTSFQVQIVVVNQTLSSAELLYRYGTATNFSSVPLTALGSNLYQATLPPAICGAPAQFYVRATGSAGTIATQPANAPTSVFTAPVGSEQTIFFDDFETDRGWAYGVAGDTATTGQWVRADPVGSGAQPEDAFSPTQCAVTGNAAVGAGVGTNDIDTGFTTLVSPAIDLSSGGNPIITYRRWFSNNAGANPNVKTMRVEISNNNGATWTTAETVGPTTQNSGGWLLGTINVQSLFPTLGSQVRVRFVPDDTGTGSVVEAAVDDFRVYRISCVSCLADYDRSGAVNTNDIFAFLNAWFAGDAGADFDGASGLTVQDIFSFLNIWFAGCP